MHILHVIRTLDPAWGGPVEGVRNLRVQARAKGHCVDVVAVDKPTAPWLAAWGTGVYGVGSSVLRYGFSFQLDRWLANNAQRYDVIVINGIWMYFSYATWRAATRLQVPYCLFIHGALDPWFKRRYPFKHLKKTVYWKLYEQKVLRDAQAVMFTTEEERQLADQAFHPYTCRPTVVGYGIEDPPADQTDRKLILQEFTATHPGLAKRDFFLFLARIHEKKGIDLLLKAFAASRALYSNAALVIAGPGDPRTVEPFQQLAASLGIADAVVWTGPLYGSAKWRAMRAADAYILPSHQENFGISVVEALACGSPVLISDKVNIWREVVGAGAGLAAPDDVPGTTSLLERWAKLSAESKRAMRLAARACFSVHFDVSSSTARFFDVIEQASRNAQAAHG